MDALDFSDLLSALIGRARLPRRQVAAQSGVPVRTLNNWLDGIVLKPQTPDGLLKVAAILTLTRDETDRLLGAAQQAALADLQRHAVELGDHRLQALLAPWIGDGETAPPPESASPQRRHSPRLVAPPAPRHPCFGREHERLALQHLVSGQGQRLVTVTGPPGIGKTHLALTVAANLAGAFPAGIAFASLAEIADPAMFLPAVAHAVGLHAAGAAPLIDQLAEALAARRLLLILDTFEHLREAAPILAGLLQRAPGLTVLATSRVPLHILDEIPLIVPPLAAPDPAELPAGTDYMIFPAAQLMAYAARKAAPAWTIAPADEARIAAICHRLDGMPLALILVASRVRNWSLSHLSDHLSEHLQAETLGPRDLPKRQWTLGATIAWSAACLSQPALRLLGALTVFADGWTLDAMQAVCAGDPQPTAAVALDELLDHHLVSHHEDRAGATRFGMLAIIRSVVRSRQPPPEGAELSHAEYYCALAEAAEAALRGPDQLATVMRLREELGNLRGALAWGTAQVDGAIALRLCGALWWFWRLQTMLDEGRHWLQAALACGPPASAHGAPGALAAIQGGPGASRAKAMAGLAAILQLQEHQEASVTWSLRSEEAAIAVGDDDTLAYAWGNLGLLAHKRGDVAWGRYYLAQSLALRQQQGEPWGIAQTLCTMAAAALYEGDLATARRRAAESLAIRRQLGDTWGCAVAATHVGYTAILAGEYDLAWRTTQDVLAPLYQIGDQRMLADAVMVLVGVAAAAGQVIRAGLLWGVADGLLLARGVQADRERLYAPLVAPLAAYRDQALLRAMRQRGQALDWPVWQALAREYEWSRSAPAERARVG